MTIRTARDWRNMKYRLSEIPTDELTNLLAYVEHTAHQVACFGHAVEAEMILRDQDKIARLSGSMNRPRNDLVQQFLEQLSNAH
jgi:hypothetical protein